MRVLIINSSDTVGGAAVAANRLMEALNANGVKTHMLVREKSGNQLTVSALKPAWRQQWNFLWERFVIWVAMKLCRKRIFEADIANAGTDITHLKEFQDADIIHLHWINQGMLSLHDIRKILDSGKRVFWTMHDLWPATAVCHYARGCEQFHTGCDKCPLMPGSSLPRRVFKKKQQMLSGKKVTFVCCSEWLKGEAEKSALLKGQNIVSIPNPIDTRTFRPHDKQLCRLQLGLPADANIILFVSQRVTDPRKGMEYFVEAVNMLGEHKDEKRAGQEGRKTIVAILGGHAEEVAEKLTLPAAPLGYISEPLRIAAVYSAADVFVLPSMEDNLPNTIMEAMACGVPAVGFNVGGIPEMIEHRQNGYVAESGNAADLAAGISFVLGHPDADSLHKACLHKVNRCYSQQAVVKKFLELQASR